MTAAMLDGGHYWDDCGQTCLRCGDKDWMADRCCSNYKKVVKPWEQYCPLCSRMITASNIKEVEDLDHDGYAFVHDDIPHTDAEIDALAYGIN